MNEIQFIKDHGVDKAREVVEGAPEGFKGYNDVINKYTRGVWFSRDVLLSDLKRLIESVELVEHFGNDLVGAQQLLDFSKDCKTIELSGSVITVELLKQAIADYEQLFGNTETLELETLRDCDTSPNCKKFDERVK